MGRIAQFVDDLADATLKHLTTVSPDRWMAGIYPVANGEGCLIAHAECAGRGLLPSINVCDPIGDRFDALCERFGDARIGHLISERAGRILRERSTNDSPVETELVPVSVHVSLNCEPVEVGA